MPEENVELLVEIECALETLVKVCEDHVCEECPLLRLCQNIWNYDFDYLKEVIFETYGM